MANFETFMKRMVPLANDPTVTIQKRGNISLNKAAQVALGEPAAVELLYDSAAKIVGMRGVDASVQHAYPLRPQKEGIGPYIVAGMAFTRYYDIDTTEARRWTAVVEDGILCINLNDEHVITTSNRNGHGHPDGQTAAVSVEVPVGDLPK